MVFKNEETMYEFIADWLQNRDIDPCYYVITDKPKKSGYDFRYGTKTYYADVLGSYEKDGVPHFVGIEVKNSARTTQKSLRQARALQSFCREVFVAMPEDAFQDLQTQDQEDIFTLIGKDQIGLLLLDEFGNVTERIERKLSGFRMDLYSDAEHFIRGISLEEGNALLDNFLNKRYRRHYPLLEDNWKVEEDDEGIKLLHIDSSKRERGNILFLQDTIKMNVTLELSSVLKWWMIEQIEDDDEMMREAIEKMAESVKHDTFKNEKVKLPIWISFLDWDEKPLLKVKLDTLSSPDRIMTTLNTGRKLQTYYITIETEYERPLPLVTTSRDWDFIDDLREIYSGFVALSEILEGNF
ncbi:MAG: hypothetical protein ACFFBJ_12935 [Promethearchaeota archaeon]